MITIYEYIATNYPDECVDLCNKFGYQVRNADEPGGISRCLEQLVGAEGETAFRELAALHPDRDVLVELFGTSMQMMEKKCNCKKERSATEPYIAAAAQTNNTQLQQGNLFLMGAILIVAVAVIANSK